VIEGNSAELNAVMLMMIKGPNKYAKKIKIYIPIIKFIK